MTPSALTIQEQHIISPTEHTHLLVEVAALRAELDRLKQQEPVAHFNMAVNETVGAIAYECAKHKLQSGTPLYLAAGAAA